MSYFQIVTENVADETTTVLDFPSVEFGIAQAVFQGLAIRAEYSHVTLFTIGAGEKRVTLATKADFVAAMRARSADQPPPFAFGDRRL